MATLLEDLRARIDELQARIEADLEASRERFRYRIERGRAVFDKAVKREHRALRVGVLPYLWRTRLLVMVTAPFIYALIVPFVLLDLFVSVYQAVCFPVYGIGKVRRGDHFVLDRHLLGYLNPLEKLNCVYCSYGNGLLSYAGEIAARTEQYWCPIKYSRKAVRHDRHADFIDYGDANGWRDDLDGLRQKLRPPEP
ncbi:MAG: hypothetical protein U1D35_04860 [Paracoccaceae bacterium]|nr:hypothetical protein [Paracoccaceae bacterium]